MAVLELASAGSRGNHVLVRIRATQGSNPSSPGWTVWVPTRNRGVRASFFCRLPRAFPAATSWPESGRRAASWPELGRRATSSALIYPLPWRACPPSDGVRAFSLCVARLPMSLYAPANPRVHRAYGAPRSIGYQGCPHGCDGAQPCPVGRPRDARAVGAQGDWSHSPCNGPVRHPLIGLMAAHRSGTG
jgi:hypothetical protein